MPESCQTPAHTETVPDERTIMKPIRVLLRTLLFVATLLPAIAVHGQTYQFTSPITGYLSLGAREAGPGNVTYTNGVQLPENIFGIFNGALMEFQTLTETIYLDLTNKTIRQVGFVSVSPSSDTFLTHEQMVISNQTVTADTLISLTLLEGGLAFDTGVEPITYDSLHSVYTCNGNIFPSPLTVNGSFTTITGGQTNSGPIHYKLSRLGGSADYY